jgi:hypothetical protein
MGILALVFHWAPRDIYELSFEELRWWGKIATEYMEQLRQFKR